MSEQVPSKELDAAAWLVRWVETGSKCSRSFTSYDEALRWAAALMRAGISDRAVVPLYEQSTPEPRALLDKIDRLQQLLSCAYQLAGVVGAPVRFLDAFSRYEGDIDSLLPVSIDELKSLRAEQPPVGWTGCSCVCAHGVSMKVSCKECSKETSQPPAAPAAWQRVVDSPYEPGPRMQFSDSKNRPMGDGWEPLYLRPAQPPDDEWCNDCREAHILLSKKGVADGELLDRIEMAIDGAAGEQQAAPTPIPDDFDLAARLNVVYNRLFIEGRPCEQEEAEILYAAIGALSAAPPPVDDRKEAALHRYDRLTACTSRWHELAVSMGYDGVEPALLSLQAMERGPRSTPTKEVSHD